jgi:ribulose bisphosphate carboxylase small subunit|tara:strand:+ start:159 stop:278 length:120 start_codon:yes stop_codon:yes gene_type:complete
MTEEFTLSTNLSSEEIKERIQKLLNKKWGIPFQSIFFKK